MGNYINKKTLGIISIATGIIFLFIPVVPSSPFFIAGLIMLGVITKDHFKKGKLSGNENNWQPKAIYDKLLSVKFNYYILAFALLIVVRLLAPVILVNNPEAMDSVYRLQENFNQKFFIYTKTYPSLNADSVSFDFGIVKEGEEVKHSFIIKNTGNAPLVIMEINPGCGCTNVKVSKEILNPEESAELSFLINTIGRSGMFTNKIVLKTNHPMQPYYTFEVKGWIGSGVIIEPSLANMGYLESGGKIEGSIRVFHWGVDNFRLLKVYSENGFVKIDGISIVDDHHIEIMAHLVAEKTNKEVAHKDSLIFVTNDKKRKEIMEPVGWTVVPEGKMPPNACGQ